MTKMILGPTPKNVHFAMHTFAQEFAQGTKSCHRNRFAKTYRAYS